METDPSKGLIILSVINFLLITASSSTGLAISTYDVTSRSVYVQWSKVSNATSYRITATPVLPGSQSVYSVYDESTVTGTVNMLIPNTNYKITVDAMDTEGNILDEAQTHQLTAPEVPSIDQAYSKVSDSITVEWTEEPGATKYLLIAQNGESFFETFASNSPGTITGLQDATPYIITVRSINSAGKSQPSLPKIAITVLSSVSAIVESPSSNSIIVSWSELPPAVMYSAVIMRADGLGTRWSENTTSTFFNFTSLDPGTAYIIKINAWDSSGIPGDDSTFNYVTRPSAPSEIQIINTPGGLGAQFIINGTDAGTNYTIHLVSGDTSINCSTTDSLCTISSLQCSTEYKVYLEAINEAGSTPSSNSWIFTSVPCAPSGIAVAEADPGTLTVSWSSVNLSDYYVVFVKSDDGLEVHCNTSQTQCFFPSECGFIYSMSVFAYNRAGQSPPGEIVSYTTVSCCPADFGPAFVSSDTLEIVWSPVRGAELYETRADDGFNVIFCNDTATVCALSGLQCDTQYNVTVFSLSESKGSNASCASKSMRTAPCSPEITNITMSNATSFTVHWKPNNMNAWYTVTASGEAGLWECTSSNTYCSLMDLPCGSEYLVSMVANSSEGTSLPSYSMSLETAPCCPANLSVAQVTQSMTNVSWSVATGAQTYTTVLESTKGRAKCHTDEGHCLLGCITCGTSYSVSLQAISKTGETTVCNYHGYSSSPCCPSGVKLYRLSNNATRVSWRASAGPSNYTVTLYGSKANFTCNPNSNYSYCDITDIPCGDVYTVVVSPISTSENQLLFCSKKIYSVTCSGSSLGMVIYRRKRSII